MNYPTCKNCGYEFDADETWYSSHSKDSQVYSGDGDISNLKCHSCGEKFYAMCVHVISWKQVDEDGDEL